ncbi:hypothetical protein [Streptomyces sp. NRRL F-5135]|uniref:hypothetical protein n=1 Tax=Streptomyces sp. NRRL F-5135 TaxID=1463858 RepID=UPI0004C8C2D9|nr:hypothetical protein [Streptomyces sp. NRRL F-5135]
MHRKASAYVPGLAALLVAAVAGCSGGSGGDGSAADAKPGTSSSTTTAQPGKYRTLREPCGSVPRATLESLLPGAASLPEEQREKVYAGTAAVTYDTDRRVGCDWKADSPEASHQLAIDVERVVSYDPTVSDDDRAQEVYGEKEAAADLPVITPSDSPDPGATTGDGTPSEDQNDPGRNGSNQNSPDEDGSNQGSTGKTTQNGTQGTAQDESQGVGQDTEPGTTPQSGSPSPSSSPGAPTTPEDLQPRRLEGLGDAAFLDDVLARPGSAARNRTVSVVFRTSNVIVTVRYTEQPARTTGVPDSEELQEKARNLARTLADQLDE